MPNLLKETLEELKDNGFKPEDVMWVGSRDGTYAISWDEFIKIANVRYDSGYGGQEIAEDLVVVGNQFWLTREEYDGSEWWRCNQLPVLYSNSKKFDNVIVGQACPGTIRHINKRSD